MNWVECILKQITFTRHCQVEQDNFISNVAPEANEVKLKNDWLSKFCGRAEKFQTSVETKSCNVDSFLLWKKVACFVDQDTSAKVQTLVAFSQNIHFLMNVLIAIRIQTRVVVEEVDH